MTQYNRQPESVTGYGCATGADKKRNSWNVNDAIYIMISCFLFISPFIDYR